MVAPCYCFGRIHPHATPDSGNSRRAFLGRKFIIRLVLTRSCALRLLNRLRTRFIALVYPTATSSGARLAKEKSSGPVDYPERLHTATADRRCRVPNVRNVALQKFSLRNITIPRVSLGSVFIAAAMCTKQTYLSNVSGNLCTVLL